MAKFYETIQSPLGKCLRPDRCGHCDPGAGARRMARPAFAPDLYGVGPVGGHVPASARVGFHPRIEDYDYWCVASINGRFSIPELHSLLDALSATTADFPDLIPEESNQTRSFSMEFSRALLQHFLHASWRYEHLTEEYLMVIDVDIAVPACCIMNGGVPDV